MVYWGGNVSPIPLHSRFSTFRLPSFWPTEKYTSRTIFYGLGRAETACLKGSDASAETFMRSAACVARKGGKTVLIKRRHCGEKTLLYLKYILVMCLNFIKTVMVLSDKNLGGITSLLSLLST